MIVIPAIDILDRQCVRLKAGQFNEKTIYFMDPMEAAQYWKDQGAKRLHVVDLDGARAAQPVNAALINCMVKVMHPIPVQVGGGIRDMMALESYFSAGVQACILGTAAVSDRSFFEEACQQYRGKIIAGLDARGDRIAVEGWEKEGDVNLFECAHWVAQAGAEAIIYTDIDRDGMLSGVNVGGLEELARQSRIPVIASGGVATLTDIENLLACHVHIFGVITGRALYQKTLNLSEANRLIEQWNQKNNECTL